MEWRNVIHNGIEYTDYMVSDTGRFKSVDRFISYETRLRNGKIQTVTKKEIGKENSYSGFDADGYLMVRILRHPDIKIRCSIHRLVAMTFIPNPENKKEVNHKNGIITDNRVENLEWVTPTENMHHSFTNFRKCKVTRDQCDEIIEKWKNKTHSNKQLCEEYNISPAQVSRIANLKRRQFKW